MFELISRREAKSRALLRYFTGKPCKQGHLTERYVSSTRCIRCVADRNARPDVKALVVAASAAYYAREEVKQRKRIYALNRWHSSPEVKEKGRISDRKRYKNPARQAKMRLYKETRRAKRWWVATHARRKSDLSYRLSKLLRNRFLRALHGNYKTGSAVDALGCSIDYFKFHMARQFQKGMTWSNMGKGKGKWNIDHIIPMSSFDLTDIAQVAVACNYKNMRPLWQEDNGKKKAKHPIDFARSRGLLL